MSWLDQVRLDACTFTLVRVPSKGIAQAIALIGKTTQHYFITIFANGWLNARTDFHGARFLVRNSLQQEFFSYFVCWISISLSLRNPYRIATVKLRLEYLQGKYLCDRIYAFNISIIRA